MNDSTPLDGWSADAARRLYNIPHWGRGYFDVGRDGHLYAHPDGGGDGIDLYRLAGEIRQSGLNLPVLVRFTNILHHQVDALHAAFQEAMEYDDYQGRFTLVYPIKVNQQKRVVEEILGHGRDRVGLEAGSKPELMAVLALARRDGGVIVCNGYKDREYIRLALIGRRLGHRIFIVVEKLSELELVIQEAADLGIEPLLGVRVRLSSLGAGKWQQTGGEKAKFGLTAEQLIHTVERLRAAGMLDSLRLMHFHMGSQIANIRDIQRGMREAARYYAELRQLGAPLTTVDVGGGLGVDYEGACSRSACSMNYSLGEYANNVVHTLWEACTEYQLPHPEIITECGRALTAHHAVLITNVIDQDGPGGEPLPEAPGEESPLLLQSLHQTWAELDRIPPLEAYHDAVHWLGEARDMFNHGLLDLAGRARAESLYIAICLGVRDRLRSEVRAQRELLDELNEKLADKYFINLSVFQSLPDVWAIDQIFPILPLHRLDREPQRRVVLQDLTCDSDGRIDHYVEEHGVESTLALHPFLPGEPYLLGIFLVGAYQETLGDIHNLFGDTDAVDVERLADGGYRLVQPEHGETVDELLRMVHFNPRDLSAAYRAKVHAAGLPEAQRTQYLMELEAGLSGYTYLED